MDQQEMTAPPEAEIRDAVAFPEILLHDGLAPLFWPAKRLDKPSAWVGHIPFAHWIMRAAMPRVVVELGSHNGVSYSAFCEANMRTGGSARCFAIDTWQGDAHAGRYSESVYSDWKRFHDVHYSAFSTMLRMTFDEALTRFADASVDILHIDGLHTYEAVRHDFETWLPKLSDRSVVLFHDTNERRDDFGVWRFWEEVAKRYPSFEFLHSHGLGVLCVGSNAPEQLFRLCALTAPNDIAATCERFDFAGSRWMADARVIALEQRLRMIEKYIPVRQAGRARRFILGLLAPRRASSTP